eukprot:TRINITY_DN7966_c0_g1_i1.p1 TRINITY_DN7966_c0_g1~~TRINITY_DN7966_c0_g1_i1.p1  ORF type:complete len:177 (-),score=30.69 TRINITY_DN7966_c0_g1_i1:66-566(-)
MSLPDSHYPVPLPRTQQTTIVHGVLQTLERERAEMVAQLSALERENSQLKEAAIVDQGTISRTQHQIRVAEATEARLDQQLDEARSELASIQKNTNALQKRNAALAKEIEFLRAPHPDDAAAYLAAMAAERQRLDEEVRLLRENITVLLELAKRRTLTGSPTRLSS